MASLVLSVAGGAAGALFGPVGALVGRAVGALAGNLLDHALLDSTSARARNVEGPRLADLDVMASTEGAPIARVYGRARLAGQVIWATRLEEVVATTAQSGGGGGKGMGGTQTTVTTTTYTYYANFAVGLCEGPIGRVGRIWADGDLLDLSGLNVRFYTGTEDQAADALIVAKQGTGNAPAYRGLAYVVFERLALESFGNRIPQLSFEIVRPVGALERMIRAVTLIPGTTEFGYEPSTVTRRSGLARSAAENRHVATAPSDVEAALDDLQALCPNLARVAIVVAWFGNDLRAGACEVRPAVDSAIKQTNGATWSVAGLSRTQAHLVSEVDGRPAFGGTPSDDSVRHLIAELKARGLQVTLYPFLMMDIPSGNALPDPWTGAATQPTYPWRGRITCDPAPGQADSPDGTSDAQAQVDAFFAASDPGAWGYRRMVLHYAALAAAAGGVDAFLIGSELKGLTRLRAASGNYPAVTALAQLASDVKSVLGPDTCITYGADWTEYGAHVVNSDATEVRFPLDALWASSAIDVVGIDFYPPLADWRDSADHADRALSSSIHDQTYLAGNLRRGEAYDWFYADDAARTAQARAPITDGLGKPWIYRAKDIWNWWSNPHYERIAGAELPAPTAWVAQSKPIWLTEVGCPAVDKGANQPSVFPDSKSAEGGLPHFSSGDRDDLMQRRFLEAVLTTFDPALGAGLSDNPVSSSTGARMVDPATIHVWTWDARPFPLFPAAVEVWSDGPNWETGHWLTGRLGSCALDGLLAAMLGDAGIADCDTTALGAGPEGYVVDRPMSPRAAIEPLAATFAFEALADGATLRFVGRGGPPIAELFEDDLIAADRGGPARFVRAQETELPNDLSLGFTDLNLDYRRAAVMSRRLVGGSAKTAHADLAAIIEREAAERRANIWLQDLWAGREQAEFALPPSRLALMPGDVVGLTVDGRRRLVEIRELVEGAARKVTARAIDPEVFAVPLPAVQRQAPALPDAVGPAEVVMLDLPTLPGDDAAVLLRAAITADPWPGPVAVWRSFDGAAFERLAVAMAPATMGETLDPVPAGPVGRFDRGTTFRVELSRGVLTSVSNTVLLGGANSAALVQPDGSAEIIQFANAELVGERTYALSRLLRGQTGSEWAIGGPLDAGARFVLLDDSLVELARGIEWFGRMMELRVVAADLSYDDPTAVTLMATPQATALRPLTPVHLRARREAAGISISWIRRTRRDGDSWAAVDVPLGEDVEAYVVDILSGSVVVRSLSATEPSVLYPAADELTDFGVPLATLTVRIAQVSAVAGNGFAAQADLHVL